jgi:hypothetical protein
MMDFNDAGPQRSFAVIPADTIAPLQLKIRRGNAGPDGMLKRSKAGDSEALDCELVVVEGPYAKRKLWSLMTVTGTTEGHATAAEITRRLLRGILESARGIRPDDMSEVAKQGRQITGYGDLDGLRFIGRIGVEPAQNNYPAKNTLLEAITPDRRDWHSVEQTAQESRATPTLIPAVAKPETVKIERPQWAK